MAGNGKETFLPALAKSFDKINDELTVNTADFAAACERILPIFDHLGRCASFTPRWTTLYIVYCNASFVRGHANATVWLLNVLNDMAVCLTDTGR